MGHHKTAATAGLRWAAGRNLCRCPCRSLGAGRCGTSAGHHHGTRYRSVPDRHRRDGHRAHCLSLGQIRAPRHQSRAVAGRCHGNRCRNAQHRRSRGAAHARHRVTRRHRTAALTGHRRKDGPGDRCNRRHGAVRGLPGIHHGRCHRRHRARDRGKSRRHGPNAGAGLPCRPGNARGPGRSRLGYRPCSRHRANRHTVDPRHHHGNR